MAISTYLANKLLDHTLKNTAYTSPTTVYLALFTSDPTKAFVTANEVDAVVDDTAYARQATTFDAAASEITQNTAAETFAAVVYGSGGAPYTVTHIGILDAVTAGNLLFFGEVPGSGVARNVGETMTFDAAQVSQTLI